MDDNSDISYDLLWLMYIISKSHGQYKCSGTLIERKESAKNNFGKLHLHQSRFSWETDVLISKSHGQYKRYVTLQMQASRIMAIFGNLSMENVL